MQPTVMIQDYFCIVHMQLTIIKQDCFWIVRYLTLPPDPPILGVKQQLDC